MSDVSVQQAVINPDAPADSLERKQPYIDNGVEMLDKSRYYSHEFMQAEADRLWSKAWLLAGVAADIPEEGDFFIFDLGLESIIVTRTDQGIRAFYNVCAHRGNRLVAAEPRCSFLGPSGPRSAGVAGGHRTTQLRLAGHGITGVAPRIRDSAKIFAGLSELRHR